MTNVIELAKQAGAETSDGIHWEFDDFDPIKFATLVRNAALEEVAKVLSIKAEVMAVTGKPCDPDELAKAIRNLKEPTP